MTAIPRPMQAGGGVNADARRRWRLDGPPTARRVFSPADDAPSPETPDSETAEAVADAERRSSSLHLDAGEMDREADGRAPCAADDRSAASRVGGEQVNGEASPSGEGCAELAASRIDADGAGAGRAAVADESDDDDAASQWEGWVLAGPERALLRRRLGELSDREFEVLVELCGGGRNDQVAKRLCIALPTLRTHLSRLNEKLGTLSKSELIAHAAAQIVRGYRDGEVERASGVGGDVSNGAGSGFS